MDSQTHACLIIAVACHTYVVECVRGSHRPSTISLSRGLAGRREEQESSQRFQFNYLTFRWREMPITTGNTKVSCQWESCQFWHSTRRGEREIDRQIDLHNNYALQAGFNSIVDDKSIEHPSFRYTSCACVSCSHVFALNRCESFCALVFLLPCPSSSSSSTSSSPAFFV